MPASGDGTRVSVSPTKESLLKVCHLPNGSCQHIIIRNLVVYGFLGCIVAANDLTVVGAESTQLLSSSFSSVISVGLDSGKIGTSAGDTITNGRQCSW